MRSYQVFAAMTPQRAAQVMKALAAETPAIFAAAVQAAGEVLKTRPAYLKRQPFEKRAEAVRRCLARVSANDLAEEVLAAYFLDCRKDLLIEWLETTGIEHQDGTLIDDAPSPPPEGELKQATSSFRETGDDPDRDLLLRAFAAQGAIEWPALEALLEEGP